jgi:hypothetical protein
MENSKPMPGKQSGDRKGTGKKVICLGILLAAATAWGQFSLPLEPYRDRGGSITGSLEGWYKNADGSYSFLLGYFNRSTTQEVNIPIGPDNRIEPGGPDRGQPTWFLPGRQWGFFTVKVPSDFGDSKLTWTITVNGQTNVIPLGLKPDYEIAPFKEAAGNEPPFLSFEENGPKVQGPAGLTVDRTVKTDSPLTIGVWVSDDVRVPSGSGAVSKTRAAHPVTLIFSKFRGPGEVKFSQVKPEVEKISWPDPKSTFFGKASTVAWFSAPGEYILEVIANDYSGEGGGGFQCCWTSGKVKVTVQP